MPHVPPTPPPKKRPSFFKKSFSGPPTPSELPFQNSSALGASTVSIHRTSDSSNSHSDSSSFATPSAGIHSHSSLKQPAFVVQAPQPPQQFSTIHNEKFRSSSITSSHSTVETSRENCQSDTLTLKQQHRTIGDNYLIGAWRNCQFIDAFLYADCEQDDNAAATAADSYHQNIPIPAHRVLLMNYSGYCRRFFNAYPGTTKEFEKCLERVWASSKTDTTQPQSDMTQFSIGNLSGAQIPVLTVPIPFYDLLKLLTLMYVGEVIIDRKNLESVQRSAIKLKMNSIEIVELKNLLIDSNGASVKISNANMLSNSDVYAKCNSSCSNCCSNDSRATFSPELNIEAVSPSPILQTVSPPPPPPPPVSPVSLPPPQSTVSVETLPENHSPKLRHNPRTIEEDSYPEHRPKLLRMSAVSEIETTNSVVEFLKKCDQYRPNISSIVSSSYLNDLMTPPITPSTAGSSSSSFSSSSLLSGQYTLPSPFNENPFFANNFLTNFMQPISRQLSAPATLTSSSIDFAKIFTGSGKSASADEANSPPLSAPPNRKRTQNLYHAAQYRDRRRQKIEQLYAEKDREEARVKEQQNIITALCSQIEKLIEVQTKTSGDEHNYRCPVCATIFNSMSKIRVHLNTAHPEQATPSASLANAIIDSTTGQLHLRSQFRNLEKEEQDFKRHWVEAQRIAHENLYRSTQFKQYVKHHQQHQQQASSHSQSLPSSSSAVH